MNADLIKSLVSGLGPVIREFVGAQTASVVAQNRLLEDRLFALEQALADREPVAPAMTREMVEEIAQAVVIVPPPLKADELRQFVDVGPMQEALETALAKIEKMGEALRDIKARPAPLTEEDVAAIARKAVPMPELPEPLTSADLRPEIDMSVREAVAAIPPAKDGKSVTVDDLTPTILSAVKVAVEQLPPPEPGAPGVGLAGALIDRDGELVVTLSDGGLLKLGKVVGSSVSLEDLAPLVERAVSEIPKPVDGFGLEDFTAGLLEDGRTIRLCFSRGELVKQYDLRVPAMIYRGIYREGEGYGPGDVVTWAGSAWHCNEETQDRPGEGSKAWRMAVKRGRDAGAPAKI